MGRYTHIITKHFDSRVQAVSEYSDIDKARERCRELNKVTDLFAPATYLVESVDLTVDGTCELLGFI